MFDEPSSYLDVKQRLNAARVIRSLLHAQSYVIAVEHDLSVLDYLSDFICVLYGMPSAYGVVTLPFSVREGINIFLEGRIPTENLRFRDESLTFKLAETADGVVNDHDRKYEYPAMTKKLGDFELEICQGSFTDSEIIVMLGQNGTGKVRPSTFTSACTESNHRLLLFVCWPVYCKLMENIKLRNSMFLTNRKRFHQSLKVQFVCCF